MKILRFLTLLPVFFYSYILYYCQSQISYEVNSYPDWFDGAMLISFLSSIVIIIIHLIMSIRGKYTGMETAIYALLLKLSTLNACMQVVMYGAFFLIVPIFGLIGAGAIVLYLISIMAMTGSVQLCSVICLFREKKLGIIASIICAVLGYCIIVDMITAVFLIYKSGKTAVYHRVNA